MKLGDIINKLSEGSCCEITINTLCDEYADGVEALKQEEWYKTAKDCRVRSIFVGMSGHMVPEINITIDR